MRRVLSRLLAADEIEARLSPSFITRASERLPRALLLEAALVIALFALALSVRLVKLGSVPLVVTGDETDNLQNAYHIIKGTGPSFFGFDWKPAPAFSVYILAWTIRIFGDSIADFRIVVVILSMLTIIGSYFTAHQLLSVPAALAAMLLLATNLWFLHFSRTAWENANSAFFAIGSCFAFVQAQRSGNDKWWVVVGVFVALGLYGYFSGRFIFLAIGASLILGVLTSALKLATAIRGAVIVAVVSSILFAPMALKIVDDWDYFNRRTQNVSVFNTSEPYEGETDPWKIIQKNVIRNYRGLILQDGAEFGRGLWARYTPSRRPPLDLISGHLLWVGLLVGLIRFRETYPWWSFFIPLFVAEVFSKGTPDLARAVIIAPFYFLFIALAIETLIHLSISRTLRLSATAVLPFLVVYSSFTNVRDYFHWQNDLRTQTARLPGIYRCEFETWRQLAIAAAARGSANLDPSVLEAEKAKLGCAPQTE